MPLQLIKVLSALPNNNWYCFRNFNLFFYFDSSNQQLISQQAYSINFTQTIKIARQLALIKGFSNDSQKTKKFTQKHSTCYHFGGNVEQVWLTTLKQLLNRHS